MTRMKNLLSKEDHYQHYENTTANLCRAWPAQNQTLWIKEFRWGMLSWNTKGKKKKSEKESSFSSPVVKLFLNQVTNTFLLDNNLCVIISMLLINHCRMMNHQTVVKSPKQCVFFNIHMVALFSACFGFVILHKYPVGGRSKATSVFMNSLLRSWPARLLISLFHNSVTEEKQNF